MAWRRIDGNQQESTIDVGADGSIEMTTRWTTNAAGQFVARETMQAGVSTRCTMVYEFVDMTTPPGLFAAREECTRTGETTPSSISSCTFDRGRLTRCDHDTVPATFPQDSDLAADVCMLSSPVAPRATNSASDVRRLASQFHRKRDRAVAVRAAL